MKKKIATTVERWDKNRIKWQSGAKTERELLKMKGLPNFKIDT